MLGSIISPLCIKRRRAGTPSRCTSMNSSSSRAPGVTSSCTHRCQHVLVKFLAKMTRFFKGVCVQDLFPLSSRVFSPQGGPLQQSIHAHLVNPTCLRTQVFLHVCGDLCGFETIAIAKSGNWPCVFLSSIQSDPVAAFMDSVMTTVNQDRAVKLMLNSNSNPLPNCCPPSGFARAHYDRHTGIRH